MAFPTKDWKNAPDATTPINAEALEDLETRLGSYVDARINLPARDTFTFSANSALPTNGEADVAAIIGPGARILGVNSFSTPVRIRIYASAAYRAADATRPIGTDPPAGSDHGVLLEIVTTASDTNYWLAPAADIHTQDATTNIFQIRLTNLGPTATPTVTLTYIPTEAST